MNSRPNFDYSAEENRDAMKAIVAEAAQIISDAAQAMNAAAVDACTKLLDLEPFIEATVRRYTKIEELPAEQQEDILRYAQRYPDKARVTWIAKMFGVSEASVRELLRRKCATDEQAGQEDSNSYGAASA